MYFLETIGEIIERAWVQGNAILPFEGGHQFQDLPVLRRRGKQKEKDYKYTVTYKITNLNYICADCRHYLNVCCLLGRYPKVY